VNIALTRVFLATAMITIISLSVYLYYSVTNTHTQTSYEDLRDVIVKSLDRSFLTGNSKIMNLQLRNSKIEKLDVNAKLKIYFNDIPDIGSLTDVQTMIQNFMTLYSANVDAQGVLIKTGNPAPQLTPTHPLLLINGTNSNESEYLLYYSTDNGLSILPRVIINLIKDPSSNNYTLTIIVPKMNIQCPGGCDQLNGIYDMNIKTVREKVTPLPFDIDLPWINGHKLMAKLESNDNNLPKSLFTEEGIQNIPMNSQIHIQVEWVNYTITLVRTG